MAMDHEDDDNLTHVASLVGYMPDEDRYDDVAHGGVLASYEGTAGIIHPNAILNTPTGFFAIGDFQFVDGAYTQSVAEYKGGDDDDWDSCNYGIWTTSIGQGYTGSVDYMAPMEDFTVFGGSFSLVESYVIYAKENNLTTTVQNLVTLDENQDWRPLAGWAADPPRNSIDGLAAHPDADNVLFILESGNPATLYRWENGTLEILDQTDSFVPGSLVAASGGDLYALTIVAAVGGAGGSTYDIDIAYFASGEGNNNGISILSDTACPTQGIYPVLAAYGTGVIIAVPDDTCTTFSFETLYESAVAHELTELSLDNVEKLVAGNNGTLWALADNQIWFNSDPTVSSFIAVDLEGITSYEIHDITFNDDDEELYVYGTDTDAWENFFFAIEIDESSYNALEFDIKDKSDGNFAAAGSVNAMASVDIGDGDVDIYVGGYFNYAGTSDDLDDAENLAVLRGADGGVWEGLDVLYPVSSLASYNGVVFISYLQCADSAGESLPIAIYDPEADNVAQFAVTPANQGPGSACVNTLVAEEDLLFIGGNFIVNLPGSPATNVYGAIAYNVTSQTWTSLNVPSSIDAPQGVGNYAINTFSVLEENGDKYVLLGGYFAFSANNNDYESLALYSLDSGTWESMASLTAGATVDQTLFKDSTNTVIAGSNLINAASSTKAQGIMNYDLAADAFTDIGTLEASTEAVLLYTTFNTTYCYAGGNFLTGMMVINLNQTGDVWTDAGSNVFNGVSGEKFFSGYSDALMYAAGGQGQDGENGYYSSIDSFQSPSGGMHWFWIVFLCILASVIVIGAVVVISVVGFMAVQKKRRQNYENV